MIKLGKYGKTIDKIVFMLIMRITNLGWVQSFFSLLDNNSRREPESGSRNIHYGLNSTCFCL